MRKLKFVSVFVLLALLLSAGMGAVVAQKPTAIARQSIDDPATTGSPELESPRELTEAEYLEEVAGLYAQHPDFELVMDLEDPNGIDPSLLPPDVASLVDSNTKIVAYREMARPDSSTRVPGLASLCNIPFFDIGCETPDGIRDMTVSDWFSDVEQFCRVYALRYDDYPPAPDLQGWEIEQQWSKWERADYSWSVYNARMRTYIPGENYCTQDDDTLNYASTFFQPTWYGNETAWWSISGFPDEAYVPFPSGWSRTRSDIYQYGYLKFDDAYTYQFWPNS